MNRRILGVVLCGGRSSRMGRDKSTLVLDDQQTFADHAVARLKGISETVCVAGRSAASFNVPVLPDPTAGRGPVTGIASALRFAAEQDYHACLVTPIDMPRLTTEDLRALLIQWHQHDTLCCASSAGDGRWQPLVAVYPVSLQAEMERLARAHDRSLSRWMDQQQPRRVVLPVESCLNINRPEDLQALNTPAT